MINKTTEEDLKEEDLNIEQTDIKTDEMFVDLFKDFPIKLKTNPPKYTPKNKSEQLYLWNNSGTIRLCFWAGGNWYYINGTIIS
jgi:hypothetical protein